MDSRPLPVCPRCGAPRILAPECPQCGVIYARAGARAPRQAPAEPTVEAAPAPAVEAVAVAPELQPWEMVPPEPERPPHLPAETLTWAGHAEDAQREYQIRLYALPVALLVAWGLVSTGFGHQIVRIFLSMWVHELGHAVTAWLGGYPAFPGPWFTPVGSSRSPLLVLGLAAGIGFLMWRAWKEERWATVVAGGLVLALQFFCTVVLGRAAMWQLIYFGGDAGCLVLGSLLMASMYVRRESQIHQGWTRWGFLVIGACAFADAFSLWMRARDDMGVIPFGANHGSGASDPSMLADVYHWSVNQLVHRYINVGVVCLSALTLLYVLGLLKARSEARAVARA